MLGVALAPNRIIIKEFPNPEPSTGEVRVRIEASAICGTDLKIYRGQTFYSGQDFSSNDSDLVVTGHESAGVVDKVGSGVKYLKKGDRVAIHPQVTCGICEYCRSGYWMHCKSLKAIGFELNGGNAEYLVAPEINCLPIPDEFDFEEAAVSTDVIGTLFNAQKRLCVSGLDTVAIFGLGPMGLGGVMVAKAMGARVIGVGKQKYQLDLGLNVGADKVINCLEDDPVFVIRELTDGKGASVVIDCTGNPEAQKTTLEAAGIFGRVAWVGIISSPKIEPSTLFLRKQITLIGTWYFNASDYCKITELILRKKMPLKSIITHRFMLEDAEEAFTLFDKKINTGKVIFLPQKRKGVV